MQATHDTQTSKLPRRKTQTALARILGQTTASTCIKRRILHRPVIQVEAVYVNEGLHIDREKAEAGPKGAASHLAPEGTRGICRKARSAGKHCQWLF